MDKHTFYIYFNTQAGYDLFFTDLIDIDKITKKYNYNLVDKVENSVAKYIQKNISNLDLSSFYNLSYNSSFLNSEQMLVFFTVLIEIFDKKKKS